MSQADEVLEAEMQKLVGGLKIEYIKGEQFIPIKQAAKFAGIHPIALEMANYLIPRAGVEAARFKLATQELLDSAEAIQSLLEHDLKKAIKLLTEGKDGDVSYRVKAHKAINVLVFWLEKRKGWKRGGKK